MMCGLEGGQPSVRGPEPGSPRWRSVALTLALPLPLPTQGKSPTHAHHPWPGRDARGDRWSGLPPSTAGAQAGTTLRGGPRTAGGLASFPSPFSPPLGYSHLPGPARRGPAARPLLCGYEGKLLRRQRRPVPGPASLLPVRPLPRPSSIPEGGGTQPVGTEGRGEKVPKERCRKSAQSKRLGCGSHVAR